VNINVSAFVLNRVVPEVPVNVVEPLTFKEPVIFSVPIKLLDPVVANEDVLAFRLDV
jgi:hypothetical protein